jgi:hypothetical protein
MPTKGAQAVDVLVPREFVTGGAFPLIERAHNAGVQVHPYTLRAEEGFLTFDADARTANFDRR